MNKPYALLLLLCCLLVAAPVKGQEKNQSGHSHMQSSRKVEVDRSPLPQLQISIPDLPVLDQQGRQRAFYSDLIKDKVVIVNFIFTTCKAVCPLSGANFSKLQSLLGNRLGKDVFLLSVSTDPETDSPAKLKDWSAQFKAQDGWTLVTGQKDELAALLRLLSGDGLNNSYHVPSLYIVNDRKKSQRWAYGLEAPDQVLKMVEELSR
jgi:protein SCO1/2